MKKIYKLVAVLMMSGLILGLACMGGVKVQAASPKVNNNLNLYLYKDQPEYSKIVYIENPVANGKITKLKNSNSKVVTVKAMNPYGILQMQPKKVGTSQITFRYAGKTFVQKVTVDKYANPCKSFKIGKTNYTKNFNKSRHFNHNGRKKDIREKISIVPNKGWKLGKIEVVTMSEGRKKVKNNSKIKMTIKETGTGVDVYFKNTKTKRTQKLTLGYSRQLIPNINMYD